MKEKSVEETIFAVVDWRSMDDLIRRFENPHNRFKHYFADRLSVHVGAILDSYVGNRLKQCVAKTFKLAARVGGMFHGRDLCKKEANDGR